MRGWSRGCICDRPRVICERLFFEAIAIARMTLLQNLQNFTWRFWRGRWTIRAVGDLGKNLRTARKERKLTQEEVADRSGVQAAEISRIEAGKRDPQVSTLLRIARALEVPPGRLLE